MNNLTGLLLGAGASYELGMPLVWELTGEIKTWLTADKIRAFNASWRQQGGGYSDRVIDDFVSMLGLPAVHYEAILGYLEAQRGRQAEYAHEYHNLYSWLVELVYHLLYARQIKNTIYLDKHLPFFDGFRVLANANCPLWVFTLNHDVLLEAIAARLSIPVHSGFSETLVRLPRRDNNGRKQGEVRAAVIKGYDLEQGSMFYPNPPMPGVNVLKIHGALDIFTFNDGRDILKLLPDGPGPHAIVDALRATNEELFYPLAGAPQGKVKTTNEITYADDAGEMQ
ncbi:hypothetical protein PY650_16765 [Rhizobium calliandrae]|uniref:SIR2-like domain-containing protein n=1 Tax=Rhizobium calliandrae TaxID=1312182 RepID=A0ABT7KFG3_9HYPH|nr:hypothetical protein [Rhizobium calliandrae]MDL2407287.1 hypothetical protein [Rhizobium calliandrae]